MSSSNLVAALVVGVITALLARFFSDDTWVWAILTGVICGAVFYAYRTLAGRRRKAR